METINVEQCDGLLGEEQCRGCGQLQKCLKGDLMWYSKLPHWMINRYLPILSGTALKVLLYLLRKTNFNPKSKHFGTCWPSREEIADATGVSLTNLSRQLVELESHGLIKRGENMPHPKPDGTYILSTVITLVHLGRIEELKRIVEKMDKAQKNDRISSLE